MNQASEGTIRADVKHELSKIIAELMELNEKYVDLTNKIRNILERS